MGGSARNPWSRSPLSLVSLCCGGLSPFQPKNATPPDTSIMSSSIESLEKKQESIASEIAALSQRLARAQVEISSSSSSDASSALAQSEDLVRLTQIASYASSAVI